MNRISVFIFVSFFLVGCNSIDSPEQNIELNEDVICTNVQKKLNDYYTNDSINVMLSSEEFQNFVSSILLNEIKLELKKKEINDQIIDQITVDYQMISSPRFVRMPFEEIPYKHFVKCYQRGWGASDMEYYMAYENLRYAVEFPSFISAPKFYFYMTRTVTFYGRTYSPGNYISWDVRYMKTTLDIDGKNTSVLFDLYDLSTFDRSDTLLYTQTLMMPGKKDSVVTSTHHVSARTYEVDEEKIYRKLSGLN